MSLYDEGKAFAGTMREWLGEGAQPDPRAQDRADVCTGRLSGKPCPNNYLGRWLIPEAIAGTVKGIIEAKNHHKLSVEGESELGWCEVCNCKLSLKVHVPPQTILNHTPAETLEKFPDFCWLKIESKQ